MVGIEISDLERLTDSAVKADRLLREDLVKFAKEVLMERVNEEARGENDSFEVAAIKLGLDVGLEVARSLSILDPKDAVLKDVSRHATGVMNLRAAKAEEIRKRGEERSKEIEALGTEEIFRLVERLKNEPVMHVLNTDWAERGLETLSNH